MRIKSLIPVAAAAMLLTSICVAQNPDTRSGQAVQRQDGANRAGSLDSRTMGPSIRASQFMGQNIQNAAGESVGKVNDVVLDARRGKINYVAVTYGGFLGIGNDLHAVPFEAFKFMQDADDADETVLVLNVTQEQMKGAKGFKESTWPNFADKSFTDSIDKRYGVDRARMHDDRMHDRMNKDNDNMRDDNDRNPGGSTEQG